MRIRLILASVLLAVIPGLSLAALDISDPYNYLSGIFQPLIDENEGRTAFRS